MMKTVKLKYILFIILIIVIIASGIFIKPLINKNNNVNRITLKDIEKIEVKLLNEYRSAEGTSYKIRLINNSTKKIVHNNVYISYPFGNDKSKRENKFKVEFEGNELNIAPGESIELNAFLPAIVYQDNELILEDEPWFKIQGYLGKVDNQHLFTIGGDLK